MLPQTPKKLFTNLSNLVSSLLPLKWLNQNAAFLNLSKHTDSRINWGLLFYSCIEVFSGQGIHAGQQNSFNLTDIHSQYNANVEAWNQDCERKNNRRAPLEQLSYTGIHYYLTRPGFCELAERAFTRVLSQVVKRDSLELGNALLQSINHCLCDAHQIIDIVVYDGCYKKVASVLSQLFPACRSAAKLEVLAQLGIQTAFSLIKQVILGVAISSARDDERKFVKLEPNKLFIFDAGYLSYKMLTLANDIGCFVLCHGKSNMTGTIKSIRVDNVDKTSEYGGLSLKDKRIQDIPLDKDVDMQVEISYQTQIGETPEGKAIKETIRHNVRVIRFQNERKANEGGYLVSNLPESVPCAIVLSLMRTRWQIENYFKELKSLTRYRGALTKSESLTKAFVYLSLLTHLCGNQVKYEFESVFNERFSSHKITEHKLSFNGQTETLGKLVIGLFSPVLKVSARRKMIKSIIDCFKRNIGSFGNSMD